MTDRPPLPPFVLESALTKVQAAEDAWNTRDPERVAGVIPSGATAATGSSAMVMTRTTQQAERGIIGHLLDLSR